MKSCCALLSGSLPLLERLCARHRPQLVAHPNPCLSPLVGSYLSDVLGGWTAQLRHRDGTLTELKHTSSGTETNGDKTVYTVRAGDRFETALGLSDVTAVVIEGVGFPLK